jgi:hypothetical protein
MRRAEAGEVDAMQELYRRYRDGVGLPVSQFSACHWMLKVAEKSPPDDLASFIRKLESEAKGVRLGYQINQWLLAAAQKGDTHAQYVLASRLEQGNQVQDTIDAYAWYNIAAASGHLDAAKARDGLRWSVFQTKKGQERSRELLKQIEEAKAAK